MDNTIVIFKYKLEVGIDNMLPAGKVLLVDSQNDELYIWIQHVLNTPYRDEYIIRGTGITDFTLDPFNNYDHVGSAI